MVGPIRRILHPRRLAAALRRWSTRDRAWVGRLAARLRTVRVDGCIVRIDSPVLSDALRCRLLYGRYERTERELLRRHLPGDLPVVELGGGIGLVSCVVNRRLTRPTQHVVVEANPELVPVLAQHRELNGASFEIVHGAIAYSSGEVGVRAGGDLLDTTVSHQERETRAPALTLARIVARRGFARCVLICDIEGSEVHLVEHEHAILRRHVAMLIVEEHPERTSAAVRQQMFATLSLAGFEVTERMRKVTVLTNAGPDNRRQAEQNTRRS